MWYSPLLLTMFFMPLPVKPRLNVITPRMVVFRCDGYTSVYKLSKLFYTESTAAQKIRESN